MKKNVNIAIVGRGISETSRVPDKMLSTEIMRPNQELREAYFGRELGWIDTPVIARSDLLKSFEGPGIVEEYDATCLIPPAAKAILDQFGNIVISL